MCIVFIRQSKSPKQLLKIVDNAYTVALHESGRRKAICWSMTVFSKELSRQCIVTAQIEPV